jgi:hypothetical protein
MSSLDFVHRFNEDGSCETICTRCFATAGRARNPNRIQWLEQVHICPTQPPPDSDFVLPNQRQEQSGLSGNDRKERRWRIPGKLESTRILLFLFSLVLCSYLLPSIIELQMMKRVGVWISCIVFGDLVGCSLLSLVLGLKKTGAGLYVCLTGFEIWLYVTGVVAKQLLPWVVDLVPTLAIAGLILFFAFRAKPIPALSTFYRFEDAPASK